MASENIQELFRLGPFKGLDYTTADNLVEPGRGIFSSNANPSRHLGALLCERGRVPIQNFSFVMPNGITALFECIGQDDTPYLLVTGPDATYLFNEVTEELIRVFNAVQFTQAIQYSTTVYTNAGQRIFMPPFSPSSIPVPGSASGTSIAFSGSSTAEIIYPSGSGVHQNIPGLTVTQTVPTAAAVSSTTALTMVISAITCPSNPYGSGTLTITLKDPSGTVVKTWPNITTTQTLTYNGPRSAGTYTWSVTAIPYGTGTGLGPPIHVFPFTCTWVSTLGYSNSTSATVTETQAYSWQYPAPVAAGNLTPSNGGSGSMDAATYFYVLTYTTTMPDGTISETSVDLDQFAAPPQFTVGAAGAITLTPANGFLFTGTNSDGTTFTTNLYRQSSLQAGYLLVTNLAANTAYTDKASDASLLTNASLEVSRDAPPCSPTNLGWLAVHKNRGWVFVVVNNADTNNLPQTQLWYTNVDRLWEFDSTAQVLLIESDVSSVTTGNAQYFGQYGNEPAGLAKAGTVLLAATRRQMWGIYGDSAESFLQRELFNIGCVAPATLRSFLGGAAWLSENGVYFFDGSSPDYNSERITNYLRSLPGGPGSPGEIGISPADQLLACSSFFNLTYYLHFPTLQQSVGYHMTNKEWLGILPYAPASYAGISVTPAAPITTTQSGQWNRVLAVRSHIGPNPAAVDCYFADDSLDLGLPQTCTWTGPAQFGPEDGAEKQYLYLTLIGPYCQGSALVTLTVDPGSDANPPKQVVWNIDDLSSGQSRKIKSLGYESGILRGFYASLTVSLTGVAGQPAPQIWGVVVWGPRPSSRLLVPQI